VAVTEIQHASGFATAASTTFAATFSTAVTAGNLIVYMIGGDKDIGTLTLSGYTLTVNLRSTSVSLVIGWKTAAGGETTITGTISGANAGGSQVEVVELAESGGGAWEVKGSATNNSNESTVTSTSSGTTGTITGAGRAIAAFASDSNATEGTVSYSNSFTAFASTASSGSGSAGYWAAAKDVTSGTVETTITRTGGSADQMSGGIVVFGRSTSGNKTITLGSGIASDEAFGTAVVTQNVSGTGVASTEAFGTAVVSQFILATGPGTAEAFGTPVLVYFIAGTGLATAEAFGSHTVAIDPTLHLLPSAIDSAEAFGTAVVEQSHVRAYVGGVAVTAYYVGGVQVSRQYVGGVAA